MYTTATNAMATVSDTGSSQAAYPTCMCGDIVETISLLRRSADGVIHFGVGLQIIQLRLQHARFRLELLSHRRHGLRAKCTAVRDLLHRDAAALRAELQELFRNRNHLPGSFELVVDGLYSKLDFIGDPRQVFVGPGELGVPFAHRGAFSSTAEQLVAQTNAHRA